MYRTSLLSLMCCVLGVLGWLLWCFSARPAHIAPLPISTSVLRASMATTSVNLRIVQSLPPGTIPAYTFGVFPFIPPTRLEAVFAPIAAEFVRVLRRPVSLLTRPTFTRFAESLHQQAFDLAFIQPFDYVRKAAPAGYLPLARLSTPLRPLVVVHTQSSVHRIEDLRDAVIALPPAQAAVSLMMKYALLQADVAPLRDTTLRYFRTHHSCLQQVLVGAADACVTALPPLRLFEAAMQTTFRVVVSLPSIPGSLFVGHPRVPENERHALRATIVSWHQTDTGRTLLKRAGYDTFTPAVDSEYDMVRTYWKEIESHDTEVVPQIPHCRDNCLAGGGRDAAGAVASLIDVAAGQP